MATDVSVNTGEQGASKITVRIVGVGYNVEVSKDLASGETLTLDEALELAGQTVDPTAVYRTAAEIVKPETALPDKATVLVAKSETNGG
jgi:hypothetical protein